MPPASGPTTSNNLPGLILLILIIAIPLAFLASISVLSLYRRAVLRTMRARGNISSGEPAPAESPAAPLESVPIPLHIETLDSGKPNEAATELLRSPWRAAAIYAIAGLCYALVTTIIFLQATKSGFHPLSFLIVFWYYAWPVAVTVSLVTAATWWAKLRIFAIYFLIIVVLGVIAAIANSAVSWLEIVSLWFLTNFPAALLLLAFLNRRIQAVGPLVLTFMILAVTGLVLFPAFVISNTWLLKLVVNIGLALGLGSGAMYLVLLLIGFTSFGALGWLALQAIGNWYRRKKTSEQSITMDAIWLLFGIFQSIGLIFEGSHWFLASLLSFVVYKAVAWAGFALARRKVSQDQKHPNLLVLRVFSLGRRSERLFDVLGMYWRFVGSIRLIAGPDLATSTMEPHEFLDFLSGKLARQFIDSPQTLDLRIAQMDLLPDYDGQFRINDFFCYDDTWRMVFARLVRESDAVIMDLRGFSSQNAGCIFEINELINRVPLGRVVFIIDRSTDEPFLRQVIQRSWEGMGTASPNRLSTSGSPGLFHLNRLGATELRRLLQILANAARSAPETQPLTGSLVSDSTS